MAGPEPFDVTHFETPDAFRTWLEAHHDTRDVLWVGYWKKATGKGGVTWEETVDVALCFGWIDGIRKTVDEEAYCVRFTPRRSGSTWSLRNLERYSAMDGAGQVHPAGEAAYRRRTEAKTGTYSFEQPRPVQLSKEYADRIRAHPEAWHDWSNRPPGYVRRVSHWVMSAKKEETRERRLGKLIEDLRAGVA
jgi:uncharacterized protein YdeI (YjbR/CyaY-like superfamily)